jgi:NAD+--dinitrogen-reductase ADP-D-ribosyltransferase
MEDNRQNPRAPASRNPSLPASARLPINRCNLPAVILGSLTYQTHPVPLELDGVRALHGSLFAALETIEAPPARAQRFMDYMTVQFRLGRPEEAGLAASNGAKKRGNANYLRLVRGWSFDSNASEGAVLKNWIETRFGLLARHHAGPLGSQDSDNRVAYLRQAATGIYATNAIEAQLDLLYTYCQYELDKQYRHTGQTVLYRGINRIDEHEILARAANGRYRVLLNNLNSFSASRERADEFGDYILEAVVPTPKVFFFNRLLPGMLRGEDEVVVIGGVYEVTISLL